MSSPADDFLRVPISLDSGEPLSAEAAVPNSADLAQVCKELFSSTRDGDLPRLSARFGLSQGAPGCDEVIVASRHRALVACRSRLLPGLALLALSSHPQRIGWLRAFAKTQVAREEQGS